MYIRELRWDDYRIEHIARDEQYAEERFGVGENRYIFSKP